jgi:glucose-1-phosphate cytidylyltransferase
MKIAILAGGLGTRLREETEYKPKPMVEIGGRPILWHIMKLYAAYGFTNFVVCLGYKGDVIRDYFLNYEIRNRDFTVTLGTQNVEILSNHGEDGWRITLAETGVHTQTGGRLKRVGRYLDGVTFMMTYGDAVGNIDIGRLLSFHRRQRKLATVTAVRASSRFGELSIADGTVTSFREKPQVEGGWINGGFFVFEPAVLDLISDESDKLEERALERLAADRELAVYQHTGFWQCMDTYREMSLLNDMWNSGEAPWKVWSEDRREATIAQIA